MKRKTVRQIRKTIGKELDAVAFPSRIQIAQAIRRGMDKRAIDELLQPTGGGVTCPAADQRPNDYDGVYFRVRVPGRVALLTAARLRALWEAIADINEAGRHLMVDRIIADKTAKK
jgi:hypothetical protein